MNIYCNTVFKDQELHSGFPNIPATYTIGWLILKKENAVLFI